MLLLLTVISQVEDASSLSTTADPLLLAKDNGFLSSIAPRYKTRPKKPPITTTEDQFELAFTEASPPWMAAKPDGVRHLEEAVHVLHHVTAPALRLLTMHKQITTALKGAMGKRGADEDQGSVVRSFRCVTCDMSVCRTCAQFCHPYVPIQCAPPLPRFSFINFFAEIHCLRMDASCLLVLRACSYHKIDSHVVQPRPPKPDVKPVLTSSFGLGMSCMPHNRPRAKGASPASSRPNTAASAVPSQTAGNEQHSTAGSEGVDPTEQLPALSSVYCQCGVTGLCRRIPGVLEEYVDCPRDGVVLTSQEHLREFLDHDCDPSERERLGFKGQDDPGSVCVSVCTPA